MQSYTSRRALYVGNTNMFSTIETLKKKYIWWSYDENIIV